MHQIAKTNKQAIRILEQGARKVFSHQSHITSETTDEMILVTC